MLSASTVSAQNSLAVHQQDGQITVFSFTEKPVVTYSDNELVLTTRKTAVQYPLYKLKKLTFDTAWDDPSRIEEQIVNAKFRFQGNAIVVTGCKPGAQLMVFDLKGKKTCQLRTDDKGCATISLNGLRKQVYVMKTDHCSFKFRKP